MGLTEVLTARIRWRRYLNDLADQQERAEAQKRAERLARLQQGVTPEDTNEVKVRKILANNGHSAKSVERIIASLKRRGQL